MRLRPLDISASCSGVKSVICVKSRERLTLERNLGVLGTLGNNAPFIGLFGTVLGIIRAFADLAKNQTGGAGPVMTGISEALVATAVGLMAAIPALMAYNFFQGQLKQWQTELDDFALEFITLSERNFT